MALALRLGNHLWPAGPRPHRRTLITSPTPPVKFCLRPARLRPHRRSSACATLWALSFCPQPAGSKTHRRKYGVYWCHPNSTLSAACSAAAPSQGAGPDGPTVRGRRCPWPGRPRPHRRKLSYRLIWLLDKGCPWSAWPRPHRSAHVLPLRLTMPCCPRPARQRLHRRTGDCKVLDKTMVPVCDLSGRSPVAGTSLSFPRTVTASCPRYTGLRSHRRRLLLKVVLMSESVRGHPTAAPTQLGRGSRCEPGHGDCPRPVLAVAPSRRVVHDSPLDGVCLSATCPAAAPSQVRGLARDGKLDHAVRGPRGRGSIAATSLHPPRTVTVSCPRYTELRSRDRCGTLSTAGKKLACPSPVKPRLHSRCVVVFIPPSRYTMSVACLAATPSQDAALIHNDAQLAPVRGLPSRGLIAGRLPGRTPCALRRCPRPVDAAAPSQDGRSAAESRSGTFVRGSPGLGPIAGRRTWSCYWPRLTACGLPGRGPIAGTGFAHAEKQANIRAHHSSPLPAA